MARCDKCQNKAWCYDGNHELTRHGCAENNWCCFSPVTNYDLLISKSPEELAEWIETIANCDSCQHFWSLGKCRGGDGTTHAACRLKWLDYLKQEAE